MSCDRFIPFRLSTAVHHVEHEKESEWTETRVKLHKACFPEANGTTGAFKKRIILVPKQLSIPSFHLLCVLDVPIDESDDGKRSLWDRSKQLFDFKNNVISLVFEIKETKTKTICSICFRTSKHSQVDSRYPFDAVCLSSSASFAVAHRNGFYPSLILFSKQHDCDYDLHFEWTIDNTENDIAPYIEFCGNDKYVIVTSKSNCVKIFYLARRFAEPLTIRTSAPVLKIIPKPCSFQFAFVDWMNRLFVSDCIVGSVCLVAEKVAAVQWKENKLVFVNGAKKMCSCFVPSVISDRVFDKKEFYQFKHEIIAFYFINDRNYVLTIERRVSEERGEDEEERVTEEMLLYAVEENGSLCPIPKFSVAIEGYFSSHVDETDEKTLVYIVSRANQTVTGYQFAKNPLLFNGSKINSFNVR